MESSSLPPFPKCLPLCLQGHFQVANSREDKAMWKANMGVQCSPCMWPTLCPIPVGPLHTTSVSENSEHRALSWVQLWHSPLHSYIPWHSSLIIPRKSPKISLGNPRITPSNTLPTRPDQQHHLLDQVRWCCTNLQCWGLPGSPQGAQGTCDTIQDLWPYLPGSVKSFGSMAERFLVWAL